MHPHADIYVLAFTGVHEKECVSGSCVEEDKSVGTVTTMSHYFGFLGCLDSGARHVILLKAGKVCFMGSVVDMGLSIVFQHCQYMFMFLVCVGIEYVCERGRNGEYVCDSRKTRVFLLGVAYVLSYCQLFILALC